MTAHNPLLDFYLYWVGQTVGQALRIRVRRNKQVPVEIDRRRQTNDQE